MSKVQKYHLRSGGHRREMIVPVDDKVFIDRKSNTPFELVGTVLPLAPSPSELPWAADNLRMCGCSREQLVQRDVNDCPYCDRRMPAANDAPNATA